MMPFLGTNPYSQNRDESRDNWQKLRFEGVREHDDDDSFRPLTFASTRDRRINFERINDKGKVLDQVKDSDDQLGYSTWRDTTIAINMSLIRREVKVKGIKDLRPIPKQVKLTYYEEEGADVDITLKLGSVVTFRKRRKVGKLVGERKKPAKEVRFVPSSAVLAFELMPANDTSSSDNAEYIHFRTAKTKRDRLSTGDYQLILNNLEFVDLPSDVDKIDYYMFLQDQIHSDEPKSDDKDFVLLSSLLINNFKNSRFVDSSETVAESNNLENRCRRKEVKVELPKWFIKRLMS